MLIRNPTAHATQIVLNAPVKTVMMPINVTHTAIVTNEIHAQLLSPGAAYEAGTELPKPFSNLRHTLSTVISHFAAAYKTVFGFNDGPPLHDALTVAYVAYPELFRAKRQRVDVELTGTHTTGETVVDIWGYIPCDDTWGRNGRNCIVVESMDVRALVDFTTL
jgi:uridine nucleosidase